VAEQDTIPLASDAEVEAAIAQAEGAAVPSLSESKDHRVVPVQPKPRAKPTGNTNPRVVIATRVPAQPTPDADPPDASPAVETRVGRALYDAVDSALTLINRPFAWVPDAVRSAAGLIAAVTIIMALLGMFLLPVLAPPDDAITILQRQSAAATSNTTND